MSTRDRLLDGALEVMRTRGLAHTTTKEIARAAGYSEATLYKSFSDKVDLFLSVLTERLPRIGLVQDGLAGRVGTGPVEQTLRELSAQTLAFYVESFPIAASVFADAELLVRHRAGVLSRGSGPEMLSRTVTGYLDAERAAGRIAATADTAAVTSALVGACFHRAFLLAFAGESVTDTERERFADKLVSTLWPALRP